MKTTQMTPNNQIANLKKMNFEPHHIEGKKHPN